MIDTVLYIVFPYVAVVLAAVVGIYRYRNDRYSYSSFSSQFLENKALFWGSVPWHYGIVLILLAHLIAVLFPGLWGALLGDPVRLYVLEITGWALGLLTVIGLALLITRRMGSPRLLVVTSLMDWLLLVALLLQVVMGVSIAILYRWGGLWYLHTAVPWLISLAKLSPQLEYIAPLPGMVKSHILMAFVIIAFFPFTRLVHVVSLPLAYLWRPYQLVIWNRRGGQARALHK
jgi:nitrate reductase gamma subunit